MNPAMKICVLLIINSYGVIDGLLLNAGWMVKILWSVTEHSSYVFKRHGFNEF